jgi:ligand-binding sensor domain-containing protein/signal transduction histidine kinase
MDKNGNLWFGTGGRGVSRYDGKSFTNFNVDHGLANNQVFDILEDRNGDIWFCTWGGISRYNGKRFINYTEADGLPDLEVRCMMEDKNGDLWFGTEKGISKFNRKTFTNYKVIPGLADNNVQSILQDKNGNIWLGTSTGASRFDGKNFFNYTTEQALADNDVRKILEDKNGTLWFGTDNGLSRYDENTFKTYDITHGLAGNRIRDLLEDKNGNLWLGTLGGVSYFDGTSFSNYTTAQGLVSDQVRSLEEDKNGSLWFGTHDHGLSRYDGRSLISFTKSQGLPASGVGSIAKNKTGEIWFGTDNGISRYDGKFFTNYTIKQGLADNYIRDIVIDKTGILWIGTSNGLSGYDGVSFTNYSTLQGLASNYINDLMEDKEGNLWITTFHGGVSKLSMDRKIITNYTTTQGIGYNHSHAVLEDKTGNIWFGHDYGGLSRYDGTAFTNYTTDQGLASNSVITIHEDKSSNLWFGTPNGLTRYDGNSFYNYSTHHDLPDKAISDIVEDKDGKIWIGSLSGFSYMTYQPKIKNQFEGSVNGTISTDNSFTNEELHEKYEPLFKNFNLKTGYPIKDVSATNGMLVESNGIIWAGTGDKLIRFDPSAILENKLKLNLFIQSVKINNEPITWNYLDYITDTNRLTMASVKIEELLLFDKLLSAPQRDSIRMKFGDITFDSIARSYPVPVNLTLPYQHNNITFDFAAIETARPQFVRYQYMLQGYDKDWNPITNKSSANFGNIQEGEYTFKLIAINPDGIKSEPLLYSFTVLPPWYRTWWADTLYVLVFLAAIWSFIKWRIRKLKNEKILLEEKVAIRTNQLKDEKEKVEATLTELKAAQAQLIQSEKMASLGQLTAGIAHEIQNPLNFINNFSEVNRELIEELKKEIENGNFEDIKSIAVHIENNEGKIINHGKRADAIVKGMLLHSRTSTGQKEPTDINVLTDEYVRLSYHGFRAKDKSFNVTLQTDFDENLSDTGKGAGKINIVPQDIGRVLLNLLNNAFYSVTENQRKFGNAYVPTVSISTRLIVPRLGGVRGAEIRVKDNGTGIPRELSDKIFQPFFTTKPTGQGTGLGLSLSYDIIKAHGGEIRVETQEGEFAEFIILLPIQ